MRALGVGAPWMTRLLGGVTPVRVGDWGPDGSDVDQRVETAEGNRPNSTRGRICGEFE